MKWRTTENIPDWGDYLSYHHSSLSIGSCFSDEIGNRLKNAGFDISVNPFGVIFNPVSILQLIQNALDGTVREELFLERDGMHFHYGYHSNISDSSKEELLKTIDGIQYAVQNKLLKGDHLFLTFGTAWAWRLKEQNAIVANCHKMPSNLFEKELIDFSRLAQFSKQLFTRLFQENPNLKVMLTVSPVRHTREGLHNNNVSKSILHLFAHHLVNAFEQVSYFPSYELVVDDLRDYRFYKEDLVHPNKQAIQYVFDHFKQSCFSAETMHKYEIHEKLRKAQAHHFLNATLDEVRKHETHIENLKKELAELS